MGNRIWNLVRMGIGSLTSKDGDGDKVGGTPGKGGAHGQETATRFPPWGIDMRPPTGGRRLLVALFGGSGLACIGERNSKAQPDYDDEDWTFTAYNEVKGTWIKLRKDGGVQIKANNVSLIEIKPNGSIELGVNGGTPVAVIKNGDAVEPTSEFVTWLKAIGIAAMNPLPLTVESRIGSAASNSTALVTKA